MKTVIAILILSLPFLLLNKTSAGIKVLNKFKPDPCNDRNFKIPKAMVLENFQKFDVEVPVSFLESFKKKCPVKFAKYGLGRGVFDYWRKTGWKAAVLDIQKKIKDSEKNNLALYKKYQLYAKKLNIPAVEQETITTYYKKNLKTQYQNWKNNIEYDSNFIIPKVDFAKIREVLEEMKSVLPHSLREIK